MVDYLRDSESAGSKPRFLQGKPEARHSSIIGWRRASISPFSARQCCTSTSLTHLRAKSKSLREGSHFRFYRAAVRHPWPCLQFRFCSKDDIYRRIAFALHRHIPLTRTLLLRLRLFSLRQGLRHSELKRRCHNLHQVLSSPTTRSWFSQDENL